MRRRLEGQLAQPRDRGAATARQSGAARPAHGRWACAYRAPTDAPCGAVVIAHQAMDDGLRDGRSRRACRAAARTGNGPRSAPAPCSSRWRCRPRSWRPSPSWDGRRPASGVAARHPLQRPVAERSAGGGERHLLDWLGVAEVEHLKDRVVLGIDRDDAWRRSAPAPRGTLRPPRPRIPCWPAPRWRRARWRPAPAPARRRPRSPPSRDRTAAPRPRSPRRGRPPTSMPVPASAAFNSGYSAGSPITARRGTKCARLRGQQLDIGLRGQRLERKSVVAIDRCAHGR